MSIHVQASDAILIRTRAVSEKMTPITVYIGVSDRQLLQDGVNRTKPLQMTFVHLCGSFVYIKPVRRNISMFVKLPLFGETSRESMCDTLIHA